MGIGVDIFRIIGFIVKRFAFTKDPRLGTAIYLGRAAWRRSGLGSIAGDWYCTYY